jgi:transposase
MVDLLLAGRLPESWLPPAHVLEIRTLVRLRKDLADDHREWQQRLQAQLFHQGVQHIPITTVQGRAQLAQAELSAAGHQFVTTGLEVIDHLNRQLALLDA